MTTSNHLLCLLRLPAENGKPPRRFGKSRTHSVRLNSNRLSPPKPSDERPYKSLLTFLWRREYRFLLSRCLRVPASSVQLLQQEYLKVLPVLCHLYRRSGQNRRRGSSHSSSSRPIPKREVRLRKEPRASLYREYRMVLSGLALQATGPLHR